MNHVTVKDNGANGAVYCLGLVGAVVYYFQHADTFGQYVVGFLKALVWPAFLVHKIMETINL